MIWLSFLETNDYALVKEEEMDEHLIEYKEDA